jgi:FkbM family methyltransferase
MGVFDIRFKTLVVFVTVLGAIVLIVPQLLTLNAPSAANCPHKPDKECPSSGIASNPILKFKNRKNQEVHGVFDTAIEIQEMNITVRYMENGENVPLNIFLMGSNTVPPFIATLAHPKEEAASSDVYKNGDMEIPTRLMFQWLLEKECSKDIGAQLVVDAGANLGYFASYSAAMGCSVIAFEPQPRLLPIISTSAHVNGVANRFKLYNNIISDNPSDRLKIRYVRSSCWGCSVVSPATADEKNTKDTFIIDATRIDSKVNRDVLLLKVDVEGYEVLAIESAVGVFEKHSIQHLLVEWSPRRWPHALDRGTKLLEDLYDRGYTIRHYNLRMYLPVGEIAKAPETFPLVGPAWEIPRDKLGAMNQYLKDNGYGEANMWITKRH